jgi:hypothetical protein
MRFTILPIAKGKYMKIRKDHLGLYCFDRTTGLNILLDEVHLEQENWDAGPRHLSLALTNACELSCAFCYAPKSPHVLRTEEIVEWCTEADVAGVLAVGFGGGEPTLFPKFADLCKTVHSETGLGVTMTTHGHRFSSELSDKLVGSVDFIRVSMDGLNQRYENARGASFAVFTEKLQIISATAPFGINVVVAEDTIPELSAILDFALQNGARQLLLLPKCSVDGMICLSDGALASLEQWILDNLDRFPLALSAHGAAEMQLPTLSISGVASASREHLHIDAKGVLRSTAFSPRGVSMRGKSFIHALSTLRKEEYDEDLVRIRN